jgi:hypothetical protein
VHEQSSPPGLNSQHREKFAADFQSLDWMRIASLTDACILHIPGKNSREGLMVLLNFVPDWLGQFCITAVGHAKSFIAAHDLHFGEFFRIMNWQTAHAHGIE